ncbi:hypothetical protein TNCV_52681 [Trichonephila clavipes]|nr:hypothetical protein TNCV_52681 [Trichonephila clavipes]
MTEEHALRQYFRVQFLGKRSNMPYRPKDWKEGMVLWVDYIMRETPAHVGTRRNRFTQHMQFRQVSSNCCAKECCLPSNKVNDGTKRPIGHVYERKNR